MHMVNTCPDTLNEVEKASKQLGCGDDEFGKNQYMCLPDTEKTSLVEFCYNGIMGIKEKGTCLEVNATNGAISTINCTDFESGCPENHYWNHQFFHYPACQNINTHHHCYIQHPSCPSNVNVNDAAEDTTNQINNYNVSLYYMFFIVSIVVFILVVLWISWKKMNWERLYTKYQTTKPSAAEIKDKDYKPTIAVEAPECEEDELLKIHTDYDDQTTPRRAGARSESHLMIPEDELPRRRSSQRLEKCDETEF
uniref:Uncharacterized protein LOC111101695 isoform X1 n=1 Tax=Crassostrea virginica TaxID=6565 RepID=A0A8B8AER9_CRAVI|nr:uncharacterized protein LOC111101695 isoform X1 [Crassostrea virginica]